MVDSAASDASSRSQPLPTPCLVALVGPPGSGKSTWAAANFSSEQIVSSDELRGRVGEHELDLAATSDAFEILDRIVEMRLGRGLTTVVDTTGLDPKRRAAYLAAARRHSVTAVAIHFTTSVGECRIRNRQRTHPVPVKALNGMIAVSRSLDLTNEGWDLVLTPEPVRMVTPKLAAARAPSNGIATAVHAIEPVGASAPTGGQRQAAKLGFGLLVSNFDWPGGTTAIGPTLAAIAAGAEAAGFDSLWVMDHVIQIPTVGAAWDPMLESYTTLGFLARATERLRLGVLVSAVTLRNVGHLAKSIATLDVLSGGRAIAGLGAGNSEREHLAYGWRFPPARERLALLEDALQALPMLWGPGNPPFSGRLLSIPDTTCYPRPLQGKVPIVVGGSGERVTLRLAATYASGCNLFGEPPEVAAKVAVLGEHCRAVGRHPDEVEVTHLGTILVGRDPVDLGERIERLRPANQGPDRYAAAVNGGTIEDHVARFRRFAEIGVGTAIVSSPDLTDPGFFTNAAELIRQVRAPRS